MAVFRNPVEIGPALYSARNLNLGTTGWVVKASAGYVRELILANLAATVRYVKICDLATAPDQTGTPILTIPVQANNTLVVAIGDGIEFKQGIALWATTGLADNDTGAPTTNDVVADVLYH